MRIESDGKTLCAPHLVARNGEAVTFEDAADCSCPTVSFHSTSNGLESAAVKSSGFGTHSVGILIEACPEAECDNPHSTITLPLEVRVIGAPEWKDLGHAAFAPSGERRSAPMEQPFFPSRCIKTKLVLRPGQPVTIGDDSLRVTVSAKIAKVCAPGGIGEEDGDKAERNMRP